MRLTWSVVSDVQDPAWPKSPEAPAWDQLDLAQASEPGVGRRLRLGSGSGRGLVT
jgi:hypothetical protein